MSHEAFEEYLSKQQLALAETASASQAIPKKKNSKNQISWGFLVYVIPFFLAMFATFAFFLETSNTKQSARTATWDRILGVTASATNREYDSNAASLTERFTFTKKR